MRRIGATVGQIQWMLFFSALVDNNFFIVWILSLFLDNKYEEDTKENWKE